MVKIGNIEELRYPSIELLKSISEEFSVIDFYSLEGYKAGIVVTPEQVVIMISQELIDSADNQERLHVYHRSFFQSIHKKIRESNSQESEITPLNISCLSTDYANFCFVDTVDFNNCTITPKMMEVVNKLMKIIWTHPKEIQYEDIRSRGKIKIKDILSDKEKIIGIPIDKFITMLDRDFARIQKSQPEERDFDDER